MATSLLPEAWPGGRKDPALVNLYIQQAATAVAVAAIPTTSYGEIGAGFDNRPFALGYCPPVQAIVPYDGTITASVMISDVVGSAVIDVLKSSIATFPAFVSITAFYQPTLSSAEISLDNLLTGWDRSVKAGDIFLFVLVSSSTIQQVTCALSITRNTTGTSAGLGVSLGALAPNDVGSADSAGIALSSSHSDHVHKGLHSVAKSGSAQIFGDATLTAGTNITLTQAGQDISIAVSGGGGGVSLGTNAGTDVSGSAGIVGVSANAIRDDHTHRGVVSVNKSGAATLYGAVTLTGSGDSTLTQAGQNIDIGRTATATAPALALATAAAGTNADAANSDHVHQQSNAQVYTQISAAGGAASMTLNAAQTNSRFIEFNGVMTTTSMTIKAADNIAREWFIFNNTTGAFTITFLTNTGTGIICTQTKKAYFYSDGTNVIRATTGI